MYRLRGSTSFFSMEMRDGRSLCATGFDLISKRAVLSNLLFFDACFCCSQLLYWMGVCEYGPDVLFVHQCNVCFGFTECCVDECSEDIEAGFSLGGDVCVWFE